MRPITSLILHHSLTADDRLLTSFHAIREYHLAHNGWTDIGYHVIQDTVGGKPLAILGRPWDIPGAHAPGRNADSLGYCIVGNFEEAPPSQETWAFAVATVRGLCKLYSIPRERILGHREVTPDRTCPGKFFNLDRFREAC